LTAGVPRGFRANALIVLADLYAEQRGDARTALALVTECLVNVPDYSNAHFAHGKILARAGELFEARNAFGRAIAAGAHDREQFVVDNEIAIWKAASEIGATLMREARWAEALAWFELASRARPAAQPLLMNRAKCHEALGDVPAAETLFGAAFVGAGDERCAIEWINFLLRHGRGAEAFAAIETALALVSDTTQALLLGVAAAAHLRSGRREAAQVAVDRAVERGSRAASTATIEALAAQFAMPELAELLPAPLSGTRAKGLRIAYPSPR
jgi:tetratricopeptide (TPR) repeat protein